MGTSLSSTEVAPTGPVPLSATLRRENRGSCEDHPSRWGATRYVRTPVTTTGCRAQPAEHRQVHRGAVGDRAARKKHSLYVAVGNRDEYPPANVSADSASARLNRAKGQVHWPRPGSSECTAAEARLSANDGATPQRDAPPASPRAGAMNQPSWRGVPSLWWHRTSSRRGANECSPPKAPAYATVSIVTSTTRPVPVRFR